MKKNMKSNVEEVRDEVKNKQNKNRNMSSKSKNKNKNMKKEKSRARTIIRKRVKTERR